MKKPYGSFMPITINFPNDVRAWISSNLRRGVAPYALATHLAANNVHPELAAAMVSAVDQQLASGAADFDATLTVDRSAIAYLPMPSLKRVQPRSFAAGQEVRTVAQLSQPKVTIYANVLSKHDCEALVAAATPRLRRSLVVDPVTGEDVAEDHRSSDGMFFRIGETSLLQQLEQRIAELTGHPEENGEGMQVLHYPTGAESTPHFDFLLQSNDVNRGSIERSGQRVATFIIYLNDVEEGGATIFPKAGLTVTPQQGYAVYFEYGNGLGQSDPASLHAGEPVIAGEKWIATKWIRAKRFIPRA